MRALALIPLLLAAPLLLPATASAQDAPAAGVAPPAASAHDEDFEPEKPTPSLALGPVTRGDVTVSADVGWLRSGLRADLGLSSWLDLVASIDTLLLYDGFGGQTGLQLGLRAIPLADGTLRAAVQFTVGEILTPGGVNLANTATLRGEGLVGVALDWATIYGRVALRGLAGGFRSSAGWTHDEEVGLGVERTFRRKLIVGAEAYVWARPGLANLGQWRIRFGYAR